MRHWKTENLADYKSDHVRRWVEANSLPTHDDNNVDDLKLKTNNNNTFDFFKNHHQAFWRAQEDMPMLLQQPSRVHLSAQQTADQPLDFTMSKFKRKTSSTVAEQLKRITNLTPQEQMMLIQTNGFYFNRSNNNKSFTRGSSPSSNSEEEGVGPPASSPRSSLPSPALRGEGKSFSYQVTLGLTI